MIRYIYWLFLVTTVVCGRAYAQKDKQSEVPDSVAMQLINVLSTLDYKPAGTSINLGDMGKMTVPKGFKFVNGKQSQDILTKIWGNPPTEEPLGMLFPEAGSPVDSVNSWAFVIRYDGMGYIKDDDADDIDYGDLLEEMQADTKESNEQRREMGYGAVALLGWAAPPFYDKERKTLHWAKELKFDGEQANTLNYDVRVLGRKGLFSLNAVGAMSDLTTIKPTIDAVIKSVAFTEGNRYADFKPDMDEVAAVGIGGLVAGKVLAKLGFFALLLKFWKVVVGGVVVAFSALRRFFGGRRQEDAGTEEAAS